ncbi:MAG: ATP-binding protein [Defluviitaleaceae bacterium]|nr:ATP-binding protein [Defluviitaleaceae bacterium]
MDNLCEADQNTIEKLKKIFDENCDRRILVLGTTCAGKSTFVRCLPGSVDQDDVCWALLPKELEAKLGGGPWTKELIDAWNNHVEDATKTVEIEAGRPMFAGSLFKSDMIVYLNVDEPTLRERARKRGVPYELAARYNEKIKVMLEATDLPVIVVDV